MPNISFSFPEPIYFSQQVADIAARLGVNPAKLSPRRAELISKGLIYSPQHGYVSFTVPMMASFIKRQAVD
jgi:hypothetical protein